MNMGAKMAEVKQHVFPFADLEPGTYRYGRTDAAPQQTVTVELNPGMHRDTRLVVRFKPGYYPSSLKDLPCDAVFTAIPADEKIVDFSELWVGDRFQTLYDDGTPLFNQVWTKLSHDTARQHSPEEIKLKERGYGYIGSATCSFEPDEKVRFVPVVLP